MAQSLEEQLASVQTAIVEVEANGQWITVDGIQYRTADLDVLYRREEALLARIRRASGGTIFDRAKVGIPGRSGGR